MSNTTSIFTYERPVLPEDCIFAISPSSIGRFFSYPKLWYNDCLTDNPKSFTGNTASVTGTICHHIYDSVQNKIPVDRDIINTQLDNYLITTPNAAIDPFQVKVDYPLVTGAVVNEYILTSTANKIETEKQMVVKISEGIYIAGTCDRVEDDCLVDFKTVGTKPTENAPISFDYKIQLLAYAIMLRSLGYEINRIRIVYGVKPTKTIGARCIVVTESINSMDEKLINDTLQLIGETVLTVKNNPSLTHLLFKSMDLKQ